MTANGQATYMIGTLVIEVVPIGAKLNIWAVFSALAETKNHPMGQGN